MGLRAGLQALRAGGPVAGPRYARNALYSAAPAVDATLPRARSPLPRPPTAIGALRRSSSLVRTAGRGVSSSVG